MRGCLLLALLALWAVPDTGQAAGAPEAAEETEAEAGPTEPPLPASMRRHGVIGRVPLPDGMDILDPDILARMRERLVLISLNVRE
ncbi:hypothetical protein [uncultured Sulfitobacter sp.]|uniref:hypothetical protein n=1 Tax=uncultured Sulfitobacter sp. TaxID=191468 RepID=UPI0030FCD0E1